MPDAAPIIDAELAAFIEGGVSIHAASRDAANVPRLTRGLGCRVLADRRCVVVYVSASQAGGMLADWAANGRIAVAFSLPRSHRTVQLKGADAAVRPAGEEDARIVGAYAQAFVEELAFLGYSRSLPRYLVGCPDADVVAVSFTVSEAYVQTPGPQAGIALR